ncbi:MAG: aminotransferase class III-fold pyridoxal phosphate-dependent enzyme, partial [Rhodocyclaceae bacterium]|nr:aminotransferase class III-fold pyridoxal phosphate-dependent enzyme [Rhodocyclaceae bacterium]
KLARFYGNKKKKIQQPQIIVMEGAFHGRSLATLSATANRKVQAGFEPLVQGFIRVPYNDIEAIQAVASRRQDVVAVLLEVIQGEGGLRSVTSEYLRALSILCKQNEWLLMCDEVQCGMGRTGKWFAWQHTEGVRPDVMTLAKGLAGGVPIGACLAAGLAANVLGPGNHGSTFGGNPLACAAALETLAVMEDECLLENAAQTGRYIREQISAALGNVRHLRALRGEGLMIGIELEQPCSELVYHARKAGVLINVTHDNVIRLLPPLNFSRAHADELIPVLVDLIKGLAAPA